MKRRARRPSGGSRKKAFALLFAFALLAMAEFAARFADIPDASAPPERVTEAKTDMAGNPWLLWQLVPGERIEHGAFVRINSRGFRGPERGTKTGPRVLALGDSSIFGFGVGEEEVFTAVLEAKGGAEFVNGGVPGYSSFQSLNLLKMRGLDLDPDVLLVGNIWSDNNFDSFVDRDLLTSYSGWEASWQHRVRTLLEESALFRWIDWTTRVGPAGERARKVGWTVGSGPRHGDRRVAINDYARNLDTFCRLMVDRGGAVLFLLLANRQDIEATGEIFAWNAYRQVMSATADRYGAGLVYLPEVFKASGRSADDLFLDLMHPTALGHALMAEAIAATLAQAGWPARPLGLSPTGEALPTYEDPFEGQGVAPLGDGVDPSNVSGSRKEANVGTPAMPVGGTAALTGEVTFPQYERGRILLDVLDPDVASGRVLASASLPGPGALHLSVRELPSSIRVRACLDVAGDGPSPTDRSATLGPVDVPSDGKIVLDFSTVELSGG